MNVVAKYTRILRGYLTLRNVFATMSAMVCSRGSMFQPYAPLLLSRRLGAI